MGAGPCGAIGWLWEVTWQGPDPPITQQQAYVSREKSHFVGGPSKLGMNILVLGIFTDDPPVEKRRR